MATQTAKPNWRDKYKGAVEVERPSGWYTWNDEGQELVGEFVSCEEFKNGHKGTILTESGPVIFSAPSILKDLLDTIDKGEMIVIHYDGELADTAKPGQNAIRSFTVLRLAGK